MSKKILSRNNFLSVIKNTPLISIDLVIKNEKQEFLFGLRADSPAKGYWFIPGGRILKNETINHAIDRITEKEIGLFFDEDCFKMLGVYDNIYPSENCFNIKGISTHYVCIAFLLTLDGLMEIMPDEQHSEFKWIKQSFILGDNTIHPLSKCFLKLL